MTGGLLFLVLTLYMIGKNQNIFGASIQVVSVVEDVSGLMPGNNVRYKGMNVGTVKSVEMSEQGNILVTAYIQRKMKPFIQKNAYTSISTDGLMGNKLLLIIPLPGEAGFIEEGDTLYARPGTDMDKLIEKLDKSSDYLNHTLLNLAAISDRLAGSNGLWELLADSAITSDLKEAVASIRDVGRQSREMARAGRSLIENLEAGDGLVTRFFTDTVMVANVEHTLENLQEGSQQVVALVEAINQVMQRVDSGEGPAGMLLTDSIARESLANTLLNIEKSTENFNLNMEALKENFLFRRYFRRQAKQEREAKEGDL